MGQAGVLIVLQRNILPFKPLCQCQLVFFQMNLTRLGQIAEKSYQQCVGKGLGLALIVAQVGDLQSDLFHYFTLYRVFQGLADL